MDVIKYDKTYTIDDINALPEGERAELINGQLYMMSAPSRTHQQIVIEIAQKLKNCIDKNKKECEVYVAPIAVYLSNNDSIYVEPDVWVVCDTSKMDEKGCHGAPDFIAEVVSPSSRSLDYLKKMIKYHEAGVREYWIVDPIDKRVYVYNFETDETFYRPFGETVRSVLCEDFEMDFSKFV